MMTIMVMTIMVMTIMMMTIADDDGGDGGDDDAAAGDVDGDDDGYNEVKQRVWLVDPTLFFPSPTPPPKVEV